MSIQTFDLMGDGVSTVFSLPGRITAVTEISGLTPGVTGAASGTSTVVLSAPQALGDRFTVKGTAPDAVTPGAGGAADGTNRFFYLDADTGGSLSEQLVYGYPGETPSGVCLVPLTGASNGDAVTVYAEAQPFVPGSNMVALVIPDTLTDGTIKVVNKTGNTLWLVTEGAVGDAFVNNGLRVPGAIQVPNGTAEYAVVSGGNTSGWLVVQLNALKDLKQSTMRDFVKVVPAIGQIAEFHYPAGFGSNMLMEYDFIRSITVLSDQPITLSAEVVAWNTTTRAYDTVVGAGVWTNNTSGQADFAGFAVTQALPQLFLDNGGYSIVPQNSVLRISATAFPGTAPTFAIVSAIIGTSRSFN